jgi:ribonuclease P/MRP protein subunit RPP1
MPKRRYADLHVRVADEGDAPDLLIKMARHLGFSLIALSFDDLHKLRDLKGIKDRAKALGVDVAIRADLRPSSPSELKKYLRKLRRSVEVIGVYCHDTSVARTAARDRRVDVTFYDPENVLSILDEGQLSLLAESGHYVEVNLVDFLHAAPDKQAKTLWNYGLALKRVTRRGIPIAVSSGASKIVDMRAPRELYAIAYLLLDEKEMAREAVSTKPMELVYLNREKLSPSFVQPGVRMVDEW